MDQKVVYFDDGEGYEVSVTLWYIAPLITRAFHRKVVVADVEEPEASSSSSAPKRELSQTTAVTQAILDNLEHDTMGESWAKALQPEFTKPYFTAVSFVSSTNVDRA